MVEKIDTAEFIKALQSGEISKAEVNGFLSKLVLDLTHTKDDLESQLNKVKQERDMALSERDRLKNELSALAKEAERSAKQSSDLDKELAEYEEKLARMNALRAELQKGQDEQTDLTRKVSEVGEQNARLRDELQNLTAVQEQLNNELESAKQISDELSMPQETEAQKPETPPQETEELNEFDTAQQAPSEQSENEENEQETPADDEVLSEPFYSNELMTSSGFDLLAMLQTMSTGAQDDGSSVQVSQTWEEESEEITNDPNSENGQIVKRIRKKTEVSVKYTNGE